MQEKKLLGNWKKEGLGWAIYGAKEINVQQGGKARQIQGI